MSPIKTAAVRECAPSSRETLAHTLKSLQRIACAVAEQCRIRQLGFWESIDEAARARRTVEKLKEKGRLTYYEDERESRRKEDREADAGRVNEAKEDLYTSVDAFLLAAEQAWKHGPGADA
jgi:hypothetical protein